MTSRFRSALILQVALLVVLLSVCGIIASVGGLRIAGAVVVAPSATLAVLSSLVGLAGLAVVLYVEPRSGRAPAPSGAR